MGYCGHIIHSPYICICANIIYILCVYMVCVLLYNTAAEDYIASTGRLTFTPVDSSMTLSVVIRDDSVVEYQERFLLALSVPKGERGVVLREPRRVAVIIANDDSKSFSGV